MTPDNFLKSSRSHVKQPLLKNRPFLPAIASSKILGGWQRSTSCLRVFPSCGLQLPAPDPPAARQRCGASDAEWPGTAEGPGMQRDRGPRDRCRCAVPSEPPGGETGLCCPRPAAAPALLLPCLLSFAGCSATLHPFLWHILPLAFHSQINFSSGLQALPGTASGFSIGLHGTSTPES